MCLTKDIRIPYLKQLTKTSEAFHWHRFYCKYTIYIEMMRRDTQIIERTVIKCCSESFQHLWEHQCLLKCFDISTILSKMMEWLNISQLLCFWDSWISGKYPSAVKEMKFCSGEFIWKEHFFRGDGDHLWNSNYAENLEQRWVKIRQDAGSSEEVTVVTLFRGKVCIRGLTFWPLIIQE